MRAPAPNSLHTLRCHPRGCGEHKANVLSSHLFFLLQSYGSAWNLLVWLLSCHTPAYANPCLCACAICINWLVIPEGMSLIKRACPFALKGRGRAYSSGIAGCWWGIFLPTYIQHLGFCFLHDSVSILVRADVVAPGSTKFIAIEECMLLRNWASQTSMKSISLREHTQQNDNCFVKVSANHWNVDVVCEQASSRIVTFVNEHV